MRILRRPLPTLIAIATISALTACGGGGSSSSAPSLPPTPPPAPLVTLQGEVVDGYVSGATVSLYPAGSSTALVTVQTDVNGKYTLPTTLNATQLLNAHLTVTGGTDLSTNRPFVRSMTTLITDPAQVDVPISPLTTLLSAMVASGATPAQASSQLATVLGLPSSAALTQDPLTLGLQQPTLLQKMAAIQQALDMLALANTSSTVDSLTAMNSAASALGAVITQQAATITAQANPSAPLPSIANLLTTTVSTQSTKFANLAAVQATAPLAAQLAKLTEATVAGSISLILQTTPNASSLSGSALSTLLHSKLDINLNAIAALQAAAQAIATQNASASPAALSAAIASPTSLVAVAADPNTGASAALKAFVLYTQSLDNIPTASTTASAAQSTLQAFVIALTAPTASTINVTAADNNAIVVIPVVGDTYAFAAGSYTYTLSNFTAGDHLSLPANYFSHATLINPLNGTLTVQADDGSSNVITIVLTGLTAAQYQNVYDVTSFNAAFGAASLASQ